MVQDRIAALAVFVDEPVGGQPSFLLGVLGGLAERRAAEGALAAVVAAGQARWPPAVVFDPVCDRVAVVAGLVVGVGDAVADLVDEPGELPLAVGRGLATERGG